MVHKARKMGSFGPGLREAQIVLWLPFGEDGKRPTSLQQKVSRVEDKRTEEGEVWVKSRYLAINGGNNGDG